LFDACVQAYGLAFVACLAQAVDRLEPCDSGNPVLEAAFVRVEAVDIFPDA